MYNMNELIVKNRDVKENIINIINTSGLPAFILKSIIKDIYEQIDGFEKQEYENALKEIEQSKQQEKQNEKNEEAKEEE